VRLLSPIILFNFISFTLFAQSVSTQMGGRAAGMGYASSCLHDEWALFNNVGGVAGVKVPVLSAAYDARPQLQGADRMAFVANLPFKIGTAAVGVFRFGDALYNEHLLSAGFGNKFSIASLGATVNYIQYTATGFGTKGVVTVGFGGIAELTKQLSIGAHIQNINQPKLTETDEEQVPTILTVGLGFTASEKVFFTTEIQKDLDYDAAFKTGLEYKPSKKFAARTGIHVNPNAFFFGLGFANTKVLIDYAFQYVPSTLASSHQASVAYKLKKK
jgi:hypothetical protein